MLKLHKEHIKICKSSKLPKAIVYQLYIYIYIYILDGRKHKSKIARIEAKKLSKSKKQKMNHAGIFRIKLC